jgi:RNA polymerase sigma factor (sigma-70 family)
LVIGATQDEIVLPRFKALGYLEQVRFVQAAQAGDLAARNTLWIRHARLAFTILNRHRVPLALAADAVQEAQLGILRSIELFNVSRLNDFSTYAVHHIRCRVRRLFRQGLLHIAVPDHLLSVYFRFRREVAEAPSPREWFDARSAWLDRDAESYRSMVRIRAAAEATSLDDRAADELPAAGPSHDPARSCEHRDLLRAVELAVESLPERDRQIIRARYGLGAGRAQTLRELGEQLGYTRERIRQIQVQIEYRLRRALYDRGPSREAVRRPRS